MVHANSHFGWLSEHVYLDVTQGDFSILLSYRGIAKQKSNVKYRLISLHLMIFISNSTDSENCLLLIFNTNPTEFSWWRLQLETFSTSLALSAGNSPVTSEFPHKRPVTRSFAVFFDLCSNKRLSKQSRRRWLETPSRSLWRHYNVVWFNQSLKSSTLRTSRYMVELQQLPMNEGIL